jgi:hypothetical protein
MSCSFSPLGKPEAISRIVSVDEAVGGGFPIYLPSSEMIQAMNLDPSPIITLEERPDDVCTYLKLDFYRREQVESPIVRMYVSNGCAVPVGMGSIEYTYLEWAQNSEVGVFEFSSKESTVLYFIEPVKLFHYHVYYQGSLTSTMEFLESMEYVY